MQKLTEKQEIVLDFIRNSIADRGYPPTLREIGNFMGIRSTNGVNDHLRALERKGYLAREDMKSRALRPLPVEGRRSVGDRDKSGSPDPANDNMMEIPILGRVAAGGLTEAIEHPEGKIHIERSFFGNGKEVFCLRVAGDSMIGAGINNGDMVFVRKSSEAKRGEIVIALVGDEATCKYYFPEESYIRLEPANSQVQPIVIRKNDWRSAQILGVVVGLYRKYS